MAPRKLIGDESGAVAVIFALLLLPLLLTIGAAIDYSRGQQFRSALQGAVDSAALAGAAAYVDSTMGTAATTAANEAMNTAITQLPSYQGTVTFSAVPAIGTTSNGAVAYTVTVTAQAAVTTTLMSLVTNSINISASAEALNPAVSSTVTLPKGISSASDKNIIYWYVVPKDGSLPVLSSSNVVYSNVPGWNANSASPPTAMGSQQIGFALVNVTGGNSSYGANGYKASAGSTHTFYSHLMPPSQLATDTTDSVTTCSKKKCTTSNPETYSTVTKNCSLQVLPTPNPSNPPASVTGSCSTALPDYAAPTCSQLAKQTMTYYWNDMGGTTDDYDYNDAVYTVTCKSAGNGSGPTGVLLVK